MPAQNPCLATQQHESPDLRRASIDTLRAEARVQEQNYVTGLPSCDAAAVELFRRAIYDRDQLAWTTVVEMYRSLLVAQSGRLLVRGLVHEDDQFCVERAFERFWQATRRAEAHQFTDLGSILKYLKLCLGSVLLDEARARRRQPTVSLEAVDPEASLSDDPAGLAVSNGARRELWQIVQAELRTDKERLVARQSFVEGHTPRQIYARQARYFDDVAEIYRLKRNIVERLRHSSQIHAHLHGFEDSWRATHA
jgi:hypothetical protein